MAVSADIIIIGLFVSEEVSDMKIESFAVEPRKEMTDIKVKTAPPKNSATAPQLSKRDRAEFDRRLITYARTVKSAVKNSELDSKPKPEPGITSEEISAEIDRLKTRTPKAAEAVPNTDNSADKKAAELLKEQIKSVSELLADKSNGLSIPVTRQLEKIYSLLCKQEKTDPNTVSEELQDEIDKLSDMLSSDKTDKEKSLTELLEEQKNKLDKLFSQTPKPDNTLSSIKNKVRQGRKLTAYEQRLLSSKDPAAYESYCKINVARSMFRCSLRNCRTRDDVIGMRLSNALSALSSYKKAIREGGDGNEVIALNAAFENELRDFSKSSNYRSLPTAAECNKFDRDIAKARRYEQEKRLEKQREQFRSKRYKKKVRKTPGDGKRTVAQVLSDPTSKKVLASRAKRTYCSCAIGLTLYKKMNSKA